MNPKLLRLEEQGGNIGQELGVSPWLVVDQGMIDAFGTLTGDTQWIHNDVPRAQRESPYGATIAHGFLLLALAPQLSDRTVDVVDVPLAVNYGLDRVRFVAPVPAGSRIRLRITLEDVRITDKGALAAFEYRFELPHADAPACVARKLTLYVP